MTSSPVPALPREAMLHNIIPHAVQRFKEYGTPATALLTFLESKELLNKALVLIPGSKRILDAKRLNAYLIPVRVPGYLEDGWFLAYPQDAPHGWSTAQSFKLITILTHEACTSMVRNGRIQVLEEIKPPPPDLPEPDESDAAETDTTSEEFNQRLMDEAASAKRELKLVMADLAKFQEEYGILRTRFLASEASLSETKAMLLQAEAKLATERREANLKLEQAEIMFGLVLDKILEK